MFLYVYIINIYRHIYIPCIKTASTSSSRYYHRIAFCTAARVDDDERTLCSTMSYYFIYIHIVPMQYIKNTTCIHILYTDQLLHALPLNIVRHWAYKIPLMRKYRGNEDLLQQDIIIFCALPWSNYRNRRVLPHPFAPLINTNPLLISISLYE